MRMSLPISKLQIQEAKVPVLYEEACRDLAACTTIDEAQFWADKAEALAAWAKIYQSDQAAIEAKRLKLHAYRRMGELALELRPRRVYSKKYMGGQEPGSLNLLKEKGLKEFHANSALKLARLSPEKFREIVNSPRPPSPVGQFLQFGSILSDHWREFSATVSRFRAFIRRNDPREFARLLDESEVKKLYEFLPDLIEWLDTLDQHLSKRKDQ